MGEAILWGVVAASPLLVGALLALWRSWPERLLGIVLGFGAGALIASIAFDLWEESLDLAGPIPLVVGVAAGALCFFAADRLLERKGKNASGTPLALGALLDGIPEQLVLGLGLASGEGVSVALVVAILVSNLPESIGSAAELREGGMSSPRIVRLWTVVTVVCAASTVAGYVLAGVMDDGWNAAVSGFAAGALLVMLVDSMIPDATSKAKDLTGLATVLGFAVAAGLALAT